MLPLWVSWLVAFTGTHLIMENVSFIDIAKDGLDGIFELLFLRNAGFSGKYYVGTAWYISALLISTLIISVPLKKYKEKYLFWMAPIFSITILGFLSHEFGSIVNVCKWVVIAYKCQLRAFAEINLGIFLFGIGQYLKKINFTRTGKALLGIVEILGYCIAVTYMMRKEAFNFDYAVIMILAVSVLLTFSEITLLYRICDKADHILGFMGKYSLYIYLNQRVCWIAVPFVFANKSYWELIVLYVISTMICALFVMAMVDLLKKYVLPLINRLMIQT